MVDDGVDSGAEVVGGEVVCVADGGEDFWDSGGGGFGEGYEGGFGVRIILAFGSNGEERGDIGCGFALNGEGEADGDEGCELDWGEE